MAQSLFIQSTDSHGMQFKSVTSKSGCPPPKTAPAALSAHRQQSRPCSHLAAGRTIKNRENRTSVFVASLQTRNGCSKFFEKVAARANGKVVRPVELPGGFLWPERICKSSPKISTYATRVFCTITLCCNLRI